jgi:acyl-CoA reductase-like NAD-dependent aldehyde dehydrogenase
MSIIKWKSLDEVVLRANNTTYGLAAGVWTKDVETASYMARALRAGEAAAAASHRSRVEHL